VRIGDVIEQHDERGSIALAVRDDLLEGDVIERLAERDHPFVRLVL